jgi:2,5-diketo-D-gluconate reductase B
MGIEDPATVTAALEAGYRHLDTAQVYGNEAVVGAGLAAADVPREAVVVATKLWTDRLGRDDVLAAARESRDRLGVDAIDLLYVHRPRGTYDSEGTPAALDAVVDAGVARAVGVSNFSVAQLEAFSEALDAPLAAHQTEFHPLFVRDRESLLAHARDHGYPLVAYSPLAGGRVFDLPPVRAVADAHGTTPAAVAIAWACHHEGVVIIPKASSREHLAANLAAASLDLSAEEIARIDAVDREEELFPE